jgi:uncharacterized protein YqfB (UPF0267 family)
VIISFSWTTGALSSGIKTVTRRDWDNEYAKRFHKGMLVDAYDKSPRAGGKKVATIRLTADAYKQKLKNMPDDHFEREGGTIYWIDKEDFIEAMGGEDKEYWVVEFELVEKEDIIK